MKTLGCLILVLMFFVNTTFSQTEQGRKLIGGVADLASSYQGDVRSFSMAVTPLFGIFVTKNFVVAARYSFVVNSVRQFNEDKKKYQTVMTYNTGIGPLLKYYFGKKQLKGLATANASYLVSTRLGNGAVRNRNGAAVGASLGFAYFINKNISIESAFSYNLTMFEKTLPLSRFGFGVGFSFFLDKKKTENNDTNNNQ